MNNVRLKFTVNALLLLMGLVVTVSGLVMQVEYHMGRLPIAQSVWGMEHGQWSGVHKFSAVVFMLLVAYHVWVHWKWYEVVFSKGLFRKNSQILVFSLLMALVSLLGLVPWLVDLLGGNQVARDTLIEIHDKLAIVFAIYIILHLFKRMKWYIKTLSKL